MWNELYEKLSNSDKEEFRRIINLLLSRNFIIRMCTIQEGMMKISPEYRFVERILSTEYLHYAGWLLQKTVTTALSRFQRV